MHIVANKEEQKKRLKLCEECSYYNKFVKTCKVCNCVMPLKVTIQSSKCPKGKWGDQKESILKRFFRFIP